ncbi:MAG TPA: FGGY-family carbohydrate kinase [Stackebrandtia sp.]|jgi:xylulokinase|uniref:FGGY-family carbohydrate kinase n=1 Tax=Stackebrandtia sp. TaxID=2023065 RepID=UPI002D2A9E9B|nr:FGGY-family carbohydrate kinase [Stackebrandtia sp.]HZE41461.1 FGGY-family carbohydrate kinase [Stackebrandtia sp.]
MSLLLGIDIGTSSAKGVLVDADGTVVARADRAHDTSTPRPGWVEHDAETVWWADFRHLASELLRAADGREIAGLCVSGIGPVLLPADADGNPLRPAILYGVDTRAGAEIEELNAEFGAGAIMDRGGTPLSSQAVGPKLRWLAKHEPQVWDRTRMLLMASSFVVHRLTGEYVLDHHSASQCDPLYDRRTRDWATDWAQTVAPGLPLPRLAWPSEVVGTVSARAAAETGLPQGLPVCAGTVDAWAESVSVGVSRPGETMVMYGTTMFLINVADDPTPHPGLWTTCGAMPGTYSLAAGMATSGAITDWLRRLVGGDFAELVAAAATVPPGSRGLLLLPYFAGERTPIFDPDARGVIAGLTLQHGPAELYRAALEGIAHGVRHNLEVMRDAGGAIDRLVAVGGGTQGGLWTQIVSDVTGEAQDIPARTMGACLGDAMLAATGVGIDADFGKWNPVEYTVRPDPARAETYEAFHQRYRRLYPATADVAHFLAARQIAASAD